MTVLYCVIAAVLFVFVLYASVGFAVFRRVFAREKKTVDKAERGEPWRSVSSELKVARDEFYAKNPAELKLSYKGAVLRGFYVDAKSDETAVLLHGWHDNLERRLLDVDTYIELGFNVFLPDLRGHGKSGGKYAGFGADRDDVTAWIEKLTEVYGEKRVLINGVSMGGATVCLLTGDRTLPDCVFAAVSDCSYTSLRLLMRHVCGRYPAFLWRPLILSLNIWRRLLCGVGIDGNEPVAAVRNSKTPTLFVHGEADTFIPKEMCRALYEACSARKAILYVKEAPHALAAWKGKELYANAVREFLNEL